MSKMRLTTLNLDDECTEILRKEQNKSRYVRAAIKRYPQVVRDLDEMEDLYMNVRNAYDALVQVICQAYGMNDATPVVDVIGAVSGETDIEIGRAHDAGHLRTLIRAGASRHGSL